MNNLGNSIVSPRLVLLLSKRSALCCNMAYRFYSLTPHSLHVGEMFCLSNIFFTLFVLNARSSAAIRNPSVSLFSLPL